MASARPRTRHIIFAFLACSAIASAWVAPLAAHHSAARAAAGCPVISGYVYYDQNFNGIMDSGEPGIAGSLIELHNSGGVMVGSTVTDASGYYQFNNDITANKAEQTVTRTLTFPNAVTDWAVTAEAAQFDPSLGTLTSVEVIHTASITSSIKAESLDSDPTTVTARVSGTLTATGPGGKTFAVTPNTAAGSFDAAPYDGTSDFAGLSGHDFGQHSASDSRTTTITDVPTLALYSGTGSVSFTERAAASSTSTGGGNVLNQINTTANGQLVLVYHYLPLTCLNAGAFRIIQPNEPSGYSDGLETSGNQAPIPGTIGTDLINVTLASSDVPNNNFGEVKASLSGYVYYDINDNGLREAGEPGIPGTTVTLTGTDSNGQSVNQNTATNSAGYYAFTNLAAGTYALAEAQPAGYLDGKDTMGSQGGKTANDRFDDIPLPGGTNGVNNNFGEIRPPGATQTPTPPVTGTVHSSTVTMTPGPVQTQTVGATPTSVNEVRGQKTPGVPATGQGIMSHTRFNIAIAALVLLAVSGWLAYVGGGQRRAAEATADNEDAGFGPDEP